MKICENADERSPIGTDSSIGLYLKRQKAGINGTEEAVLAVLVEAAALLPGEPQVAISIHEIRDRINSTYATVQRALNRLVQRCLIARRQDAKQSGEIATTLVSRAAFAYFDLQGGAAIGYGGLPAHFGPLLARETEDFIARVADAWRQGSMIGPADESSYRGLTHDLTRLRFLLQARMEELAREAAEAMGRAETAEAELASGILRMELDDQTEVILDRKALLEAAGQLPASVGSVVACSDLRVVRDVLEQIRDRGTFALTPENTPKIAAEVLFSRHKGFAVKHDAEAAGRIMANVISKGTWKRPHRIEQGWYRSAALAVRVVRPQGAQLCAA